MENAVRTTGGRERLVTLAAEAKLPSRFGLFRVVAFDAADFNVAPHSLASLETEQ